MSETKRRRGRPVIEDAKRKQIHLRVSDEFYDRVHKLSEEEGMSVTDYLIEGVRIREEAAKIIRRKED